MASVNVRTYIALLRGINVGGKNILPMPALIEIFTHCGCADVRSYIQSGNIIFSASAACAKDLLATVAQEIQKRFDIQPPVILRTAQALAAAVVGNPFASAGADAALLHVGFLADAPRAQKIKSLDPDRSPGDSFCIVGQHIYLHLPNGMGKTKLTNAWFDSKLGTISTFRNWRTVLKLVEMSQS
jgi:uncharacterized protein (DUF1697 family)